MDPQQPVSDETDDVQGHRRDIADAERDETDDVQGHRRMIADAETDETDDVSGHLTGALGNKQKEDREYR